MAKKKKIEQAKEMPQEIVKGTKVEKIVEHIEKEIQKCDDKSFNIYFYVIDTKGVPSGSLLYSYKLAYCLQELGYNVTMLHNEGKDFVGVGQWAEKKYSELKHMNIGDRKGTFSPSDFLVIPEIYTDIMSQLRSVPCKRIMLVQNFDYMTRIIPPGVSPYEYNITDAIINTECNENIVNSNLEKIHTHVIRPGISSAMFRKNDKPKKMIVNFVARDGNDISRIIKPFQWKYPQLKWVQAAQLVNLPQETFADALRDSFMTVIIDDHASFCYAALEALKTGNIVICKIPDNVPDWMYEKREDTENKNEVKDLTNSIVWVDNLNEVPDIIANLSAMWLRDDIPYELYEEIEKIARLHTMEDMMEDVKKVFVDELFVNRKCELEDALKKFKKNKEEKKEEK